MPHHLVSLAVASALFLQLSMGLGAPGQPARPSTGAKSGAVESGKPSGHDHEREKEHGGEFPRTPNYPETSGSSAPPVDVRSYLVNSAVLLKEVASWTLALAGVLSIFALPVPFISEKRILPSARGWKQLSVVLAHGLLWMVGVPLALALAGRSIFGALWYQSSSGTRLASIGMFALTAIWVLVLVRLFKWNLRRLEAEDPAPQQAA